MQRAALLLVLLLGPLDFDWALSAADILSRSDEIRMPHGDFQLQVKVTSTKPGSAPESAEYEVLLKGTDKTLIKTMAPATDRGTSILMIDRDLWVFLADVAKPVRVSMQQRLTGNVANGDLARANFTGDYKPSLVRKGKTFYELKLIAVDDHVTYGQVRLWVEKGTFRPLRAAFYAISGRLLKVGHYQDYKSLLGVMRPSKLVFEDAIEKTRQSTILYKDMTAADLPEKMFSKDYLKKLKY